METFFWLGQHPLDHPAVFGGFQCNELSGNAVFDGGLFELFDGAGSGALPGLVKVVGAGGPVPRTPWDLSLYACSSKVLKRPEAAGAFPVSVSLGAYRAGNGKRGF